MSWRILALLPLAGCWVTGAELTTKVGEPRTDPVDTEVPVDSEPPVDTDEPVDTELPTAFTCADDALGPVRGPSVASGDLMGATNDHTVACLDDAGGKDVALAWTARSDGCWLFSTDGSDYDTVIQLQGTCTGSPFACNDDLTGTLTGSSRVSRRFEEGEEVLVVIDAWAPDIQGDWNLSVQRGSAVPYDVDAGQATGSAVANGNTTNAGTTLRPGSGEGDVCPSDSGADDLVLYTAPNTGLYAFQVDADFDTVLTAFDACDQSAIRACVDQEALDSEILFLDLLRGEQVVLRIAGYRPGSNSEPDFGTWSLSVSRL